jgi:hypothetical protein
MAVTSLTCFWCQLGQSRDVVHIILSSLEAMAKRSAGFQANTGRPYYLFYDHLSFGFDTGIGFQPFPNLQSTAIEKQ